MPLPGNRIRCRATVNRLWPECHSSRNDIHPDRHRYHAGTVPDGVTTWGSTSDTHPHYSFVSEFFTQNARTDDAVERGIDFPLVQETDIAGSVNIEELVLATAEGLDIGQQRGKVSLLSQVFNELLLVVPLYERYGNNPALEGVRVVAWPVDDSLIYQNSLYADPIPSMLMFEGELEAVE